MYPRKPAIPPRMLPPQRGPPVRRRACSPYPLLRHLDETERERIRRRDDRPQRRAPLEQRAGGAPAHLDVEAPGGLDQRRVEALTRLVEGPPVAGQLVRAAARHRRALQQPHRPPAAGQQMARRQVRSVDVVGVEAVHRRRRQPGPDDHGRGQGGRQTQHVVVRVAAAEDDRPA
jgi:hypothetical protein